MMFPSTALALTLGGLAAAILFGTMLPGRSASILRRMARRQIGARPAQSLLMVAGLALAVMFITAALGLQDSFQASSVSVRLSQVGNVDEAVTGPLTQAQVQRALSRLRHTPEVQVATALYLSIAASVTASHASTPPINSYLYGVNREFDSVYGSLIDIRGRRVRVADLRPGQVFLSHQAASTAHLRAGQQITVTWYGISMRSTVRDVLATDPVVTTGELAQEIPVAGVFLPLAVVQRAFAGRFHHPLVPDTICVKNIGPGGMGDIGPNGARGRTVLRVLQDLFGVIPLDLSRNGSTFVPIYFDTFLIHPLKPDVVVSAGGLSPISSKAEYIASPAARQALGLLPAFTSLLVGAGLLLLILQCLLLGVERRAELGMSRALGLQRRHLVRALAMEGCGYAIAAVILGVPLGAAAVSIELAVLDRLPVLSLGPSAPFQFDRIPLHLALRWESAVGAAAIGLIGTLTVVVIVAGWIARAPIVTAIRDLDGPDAPPVSRPTSVGRLWTSPRGAKGRPLAESLARRRERRGEALAGLVSASLSRGFLCVLGGGACLVLASFLADDTVHSLGIVLLIAGAGLLVRWGRVISPVGHDLVSRVGMSLIGLGWLLYGLRIGALFFRVVFTPDLSVLGQGPLPSFSLVAILLYILTPLTGLVILAVRNVDVPAELLSTILRALRGCAPVSRTSLVYPVTFRFRTGVMVALVSLIAFLITLLVVNNTGATEDAQVPGAYTADLTAFLVGYLALGLVFGAFSIAVVTSRGVVERRQQIGMLRALGFSRALVRRSFLIEASFGIVLGLLTGTGLAWWIVAQAASQDRQAIPTPAGALVALLLGGYLVALVSTILPARRASRIPPAEALRYE